MPPQEIVRDIRTVQNKLLQTVPKRWAKQFGFGLQAYALKPFQSAGSNARAVVANPNTASTKADRLLANTNLANQFGIIFDNVGLVKPSSFVNLDHSDLNGLLALVGAVQTRKGRALPCMVEATFAYRASAVRAKARLWQPWTVHAIDSLQGFHDRLGFWPKLVFDRGFGNESLITYLFAAGATFYIRLKAGRIVEFDGWWIKVKQLREKDAAIQLFGLALRVIRSPKSRRAKEPWYILTNDFCSSREKIVCIYYHRFEIEETFRDMKHIWELKRTRLHKPNSLKTVLWFVSLGVALLYLVTRLDRQPRANPKKQISWVRQAYEQYQRAISPSLLFTG